MKSELRKELIKRRNELDSNYVKEKSEDVRKRLSETLSFENAELVGLYFSKDNEVLTENIISDLLKEGKRVFLSKIKLGKKEIEFREIKKLDDLEEGSFGIKEPKKSCPVVDPDKLDLIIIPCVGVDEQGNRIGRGAAYYDRFLAKQKYLKSICLAYDFQMCEGLKPEEHDRKVDLIITDKRIIRTAPYPRLLNGKKTADRILAGLKQSMKKQKIKAKLAVILVGNDPASEIYVKKKGERCSETDIGFELIRFKDDVSEKEVIAKIHELNKDKEVNGILIQLPLPEHINTDNVINAVKTEKDVDGLGKANDILECCTPKGIIRLLEKYKISLKGKKIVLIGHGRLVGKPLSLMLKKRGLKFRVCTDKTKDLKKETLEADILISATGVPHLITGEHVKQGVVIVDVGIAKKDERIVGDVDFQSVKSKALYITPVPNGVGPMTIAMLIENVIDAANRQKEK